MPLVVDSFTHFPGEELAINVHGRAVLGGRETGAWSGIAFGD